MGDQVSCSGENFDTVWGRTQGPSDSQTAHLPIKKSGDPGGKTTVLALCTVGWIASAIKQFSLVKVVWFWQAEKKGGKKSLL